WLHTYNTQIFRGFFTGRYIFDSATGFLHFASDPALGPGFGPTTAECADGTFTDISLVTGITLTSNGTCPNGSGFTGRPLPLSFLQRPPPPRAPFAASG